MTRLRLIECGSLGAPRMCEALLIDGKEPPLIKDQGEAVVVTFQPGELSAPFRAFVADETGWGLRLTADHLLLLRYLLRHAEIDTATAGRICRRGEFETRELLRAMEREYDYLGRGGTTRGAYRMLRAALYGRIAAPGQPERDRRIAWEAAKTRVLSVRRAEVGESGLTNAEVRGLTLLSRFQVFRLIGDLEHEGALTVERRGRSTRYVYRTTEES